MMAPPASCQPPTACLAKKQCRQNHGHHRLQRRQRCRIGSTQARHAGKEGDHRHHRRKQRDAADRRPGRASEYRKRWPAAQKTIKPYTASPPTSMITVAEGIAPLTRVTRSPTRM
jgi:hypothetical protein